ncbi:MAG TPA: fused MFS/spermidine synthase [Vicinamibacterales bacterium]|nr:fused MFS/spermidine synthase [Vicinamibacterales bacterium]
MPVLESGIPLATAFRRPSSQTWLLVLLAVLFFCSGASALMYQVLWLRMLGLVFGVTVYAASTVWASFMGGLALGSLVAGRLADRVRRPLLWFGAAEGSIAVSALLTPAALAMLQKLYAAVHPSLPESLAVVTLARVLMTLAVLFVPTLLMGATLPLVIKSSLMRAEELGPRIGVLYATNTAGAIAGTLVSGLFLIPRYGIHGTFFVAAAVNIAVALSASVAAFVAWPSEARSVPATDGAVPPSAPADEPTRATRLAVLAVFTASGFASLALEVIWFRVIVLLIRPTVYGFAMMLATLLLGIGAGSYLVSPFLRRRQRPWVAVLAIAELALAVVAALSVQALLLHPVALRWLTPIVARVFPEYLAFSIAASVLTIFPASLLMGIAFPIGLRLWTGSGTRLSAVVARRVGLFYALNLAGSIAGSLAAGFLLLPLAGSRWALLGVAALILLSSVLLWTQARLSRFARVAAMVASVVAFVAGAAVANDPFDVFLRLRYPDEEVLWREEGVQATVSVNRTPGGQLILNLEGSHQADDAPSSVRVHRRIGHLPMAVHPEARDALVIGLGGGATAGAVALHTGADVDVVELSGAVVRASEFFRHINHNVLRRPNVHLRVDDGRNYLMLTRRRYDVITADLILPIHAGAGNLYSAEYFRLVRNALKDDGIALQWVAGTEAEYKIIMRTFLSVFPETTLWIGGDLMIGTKKPLMLRRGDFDWKLQVPGRREALQELGIDTFEKLLAAYRAGPDELKQFVGPGPILTDDRPLVEYFLSLPRDRAADISGLRGDVRTRVR